MKPSAQTTTPFRRIRTQSRMLRMIQDSTCNNFELSQVQACMPPPAPPCNTNFQPMNRQQNNFDSQKQPSMIGEAVSMVPDSLSHTRTNALRSSQREMRARFDRHVNTHNPSVNTKIHTASFQARYAHNFEGRTGTAIKSKGLSLSTGSKIVRGLWTRTTAQSRIKSVRQRHKHSPTHTTRLLIERTDCC